MSAKLILTPPVDGAVPLSVVGVRGTGWGWRWYVELKLDGVPLGTVKSTSTKGAFATSIVVPAGTKLGARKLTGTSRRPAKASATLTVLAAPVVVPPPPPPPPIDPPPVEPPPAPAPVVPVLGPRPAAGVLLWKDFTDGKLEPFKGQVYPNEPKHDGDLMREFGEYVTDADHIRFVVVDGRKVLELVADRPAVGARWRQTLVTTGLGGTPYTATASIDPPVRVEVAAQILGGGRGAWQAIWFLANVVGWNDPQEFDWLEVLRGMFTANVRSWGYQPVEAAAVRADELWHRVGMEWTQTEVRFYLDGALKGKVVRAMTSPMSWLLDSKVGLQAPDAATPTQRLRVAWLTAVRL